MFKKIKQRIGKFESAVKNSDQGIVKAGKLGEEELALQQLLKMFENGTFFPLTQWSLSPREILHICNEITINGKSSIVEFGAGFSTICFARMLKVTSNPAKLYCVESNADWISEMQKMIGRYGLQDFVTFFYAPIADIGPEYSWNDCGKWYDTKMLSTQMIDISSIDLVVVDGPVGSMSPFSRYPAIPFLKSKLSRDVSVFLDDTYRAEEKEITGKWARIVDGRIVDNGRYAYISAGSTFVSEPFGLKKFSYS